VQEYGTLYHTAGTDITDILVNKDGRFDASQSGQTFSLTTLNRYPDSNVNLQTKAGVVTPGTENLYGMGNSYSFEQGSPI